MLCRRALQRFGPLTQRAANPTLRSAVPVRHMAFGIPGSSNMAYFVMCGGGLTAAMVYAYKTVNGDSERYNDRLAEIAAPKEAAPEVEPTPVAPEPAAEAVAVEAVAEEAEPAAVEEAVPAAPAEVVAEAAAEAVSETAAEPAVEVVAVEDVAVEAIPEAAAAVEEAAAPAEVVVESAEAAVEDAVPVAAEAGESPEAVTEAAPAAVEVEAAPAESEGFLPGLLTAVRSWAGSTGEIAAASVAEKSAVEVLRPIQENSLVLQASKVLAEQEEAYSYGEAAPDAEMPTEATGVSGDAETPHVEERPEEASAPPAEEEEATTTGSESEAPLEEEAPLGKESQPEEKADTEEPAAEEDPAASSQGEDGTQSGNAAHATDVSEEEAPKEVGPDETGALAEEAPLIAETMGHPAEADSGSDVEIIPAPVKDAGHCGACHASDNAGEGAAPPAGFQAEVQQGVDGNSGESMDLAEANEGESAVDGQLAESLTLVSAES